MELAKFIDHTYLQPDAQKKDIDKILSEAKQYHFASICISQSGFLMPTKNSLTLMSTSSRSSASQKELHRLLSKPLRRNRLSLTVLMKLIWSSRLASLRMENMIM